MTRRSNHGARSGIALVAAVLALLALPAAAGAANEGESRLTGLGAGTHASGLVAGAGGSIWFVGYRAQGVVPAAEGVVGRAGADGEVSEFSLGSPGSIGGEIASAPDGSFWFTQTSTGEVGRIAPGGAPEKFPLSPGAEPGAIVAGPGNAMWFVEEGVDRVGRVEAGGTITEFRLTPGSRPAGIAAGPDGALWITERDQARIARMSPAGVVTGTYPLPERQSSPRAIVVGPDGALWFNHASVPRIGRLTVAGTIEEFTVPAENGTDGLVLGGDGNLWFNDFFTIGSIGPSGEVGEPACVTPACDLPVTGLARGGDGNLWLATGPRVVAERPVFRFEIAEPGYVGTFSPPPLRVRLGKRATRVNDGLTTVALSCHGGSASEACRGWLRLSARLRGRRVLLDQHRYRLDPASGRRLPLLLGARGRRVLASGKRLRVQIGASLVDGSGARRNFVLQARRRR